MMTHMKTWITWEYFHIGKRLHHWKMQLQSPSTYRRFSCPAFLLTPLDYGWKMYDLNGFMVPIPMTQDPAPGFLLQTTWCNCTTGCKNRRCGCVRIGQRCKNCGCRDCANRAQVETNLPQPVPEAELDDTRTNEEFSSSEAESDFTDDDSDSDFDYLTETTGSTAAS